MLAAVLLVGVITVGGYLLKIRAPELPNRDGDTQDPGQTTSIWITATVCVRA